MGRLAIDTGGTFTDLVYFEEATGALSIAKALSTPHDLVEGVLAAIELAGTPIGDVSLFLHGGTIVINAITERKGAKTALVTTAGFRDVLEIGRGNRPDLYNLRYVKPSPLVPRRLRWEVRERFDAAGEELVPINRDDLADIVARCRSESIEAIAVQFLHSHAEPAHELAATAYLREQLPGVAITASCELTREWREYERANTAVLNAYVQPLVERYLGRLERKLEERELAGPCFAMQSNGGTAQFAWARSHPIALIESGPAAGVSGATVLGSVIGEPNIIYLDIGGTTAKCSLIKDGAPEVTTAYRVEGTPIDPGYPILVPVVDIVEIGAGGGSIARLDAAGLLRIGPESVGAEPGPACYGRGGDEPTLTDALVLAGAVNPDTFAEGRLRLQPDLARRAMEKLADGLHVSAQETAHAVIRVAEANMINALQLVSVQRGHDPRDFALVAAGGGGPLHAAALARELGVKEIIIPRDPAHFSAWGMLATKPRFDTARTALMRSDRLTVARLGEMFSDMRREATSHFVAEDGSVVDLAVTASADLRYAGQEHTVSVPLDPDDLDVAAILAAFHAAHEQAYTFQLPANAVEFVTFRLSATAEVEVARMTPVDGGVRPATPEAEGVRAVDLGEHGRHDADVYKRDRLPVGFTAPGPLIIEEPATTTIVHPGQVMRVDDFGLLRIRSD